MGRTNRQTQLARVIDFHKGMLTPPTIQLRAKRGKRSFVMVDSVQGFPPQHTQREVDYETDEEQVMIDQRKTIIELFEAIEFFAKEQPELLIDMSHF